MLSSNPFVEKIPRIFYSKFAPENGWVGRRFYILLLGDPLLNADFQGQTCAVSFREDIVSLRNSGVTLGLDSV